MLFYLKKVLSCIFVCTLSLLIFACQVPAGLNGTNGIDGVAGISPEISINEERYRVINGVKSEYQAIASTPAPIKNAVFFELNGGIMPDGSSNMLNVENGSTIVLPIPTKPHFIFCGWFSGQTINDAQFSNITPVSRDMVLYARWKKIGPSVTFIDDDGSSVFLSTWKLILDEKNINIGLAVITGRVGTTNNLSLFELTQLQAEGNEIYSHTYSHPAVYLESTTVEILEQQYQLSREWLSLNRLGFINILVYPGGLAENNPEYAEKLTITKQYFDYAVTINSKKFINVYPFDPWMLARVNGDTLSLVEIQYFIDSAISLDGWLIILTHSVNINSVNQIQKLKDVIDYCFENQVPILPLSEAITYYSPVPED